MYRYDSKEGMSSSLCALGIMSKCLQRGSVLWKPTASEAVKEKKEGLPCGFLNSSEAKSKILQARICVIWHSGQEICFMIHSFLQGPSDHTRPLSTAECARRFLSLGKDNSMECSDSSVSRGLLPAPYQQGEVRDASARPCENKSTPPWFTDLDLSAERLQVLV